MSINRQPHDRIILRIMFIVLITSFSLTNVSCKKNVEIQATEDTVAIKGEESLDKESVRKETPEEKSIKKPSMKEPDSLTPIASVDKRTEKDPKDLLEKCLRKKGGREKLKAIRTVKVKSSYSGMQGPFDTESFIQMPNKFRVDYYRNQALFQSMIYDGSKGYLVTPQSHSELAPAITEELASAIKLDFIYYLIAADEIKFDVKYLGEADVNGIRVEVIEIKLVDAPPIQLYIDRETYSQVASHYILGDKKITSYESDLREVGGVFFPFRNMVDTNGVKLDVTITDLQVNPELKPDIFQPADKK